MRKIRLIAIIILIAVSLSACGGSSSSSSSSDRYSGYVGDYYSDSVADNEMLSYRYHVSIEMLSTKTAPINIEDTYETIMDDCYRLGGYLLEKDADYYDTRDSESEVLYSGQIRITIDIPAENAETFGNTLSAYGHMIEYNQEIVNRKHDYETAEDEQERRDIEYSIEYSRFDIILKTVEKYTNAKPTFWNRVKTNIKGQLDEFVEFLSYYVTVYVFRIVQVLLIILPIIFIILGLIRFFTKVNEKLNKDSKGSATKINQPQHVDLIKAGVTYRLMLIPESNRSPVDGDDENPPE